MQIVSNAYYWLRCHLWTRYHIINISGICDYKWGWLDRDNVLLYASFKILQDFVEKEDPKIGLRTLEDFGAPCKGLEAHLEIEREVRAIYDWWVKERPTMYRAWAESYSWKVEEELDKTDEEMLIRLVKIRRYLWT